MAAAFVYRRLLSAAAIVNVMLLLPTIGAQRHTASDNPSTYNIGGVLSNFDSEEHFRRTISVSILGTLTYYISRIYVHVCVNWHYLLPQHLNFDQQYVPRKVTYYDKTIRMDKNPIKTVFNVCDKLIEKQVSRKLQRRSRSRQCKCNYYATSYHFPLGSVPPPRWLAVAVLVGDSF